MPRDWPPHPWDVVRPEARLAFAYLWSVRSPSLFAAWSRHAIAVWDIDLVPALACHPLADAALLQQLVDNPRLSLAGRVFAAAHPACPPETLWELAGSQAPRVSEAIASRPDLQAPLIARLLSGPMAEWAADALAVNPTVDEQTRVLAALLRRN